MLLGLAWYFYWTANGEELQRVLIYARRHNYIMGEGVISRTLMTPSLQAVYAEALEALGGKVYQPEASYPQLYIEGERGFTAHLMILNILLRGRYNEGIGETEAERIREHRARNPDNGLFCYAYHLYHTGNMAECISILLREDLFPKDRLPESRDRCTEWLWQREAPWEPCPEKNLVHSGGELLFVAKLIEDYLSQ
jgi:hypothetical protein